jgi:hypothetical protein
VDLQQHAQSTARSLPVIFLGMGGQVIPDCQLHEITDILNARIYKVA